MHPLVLKLGHLIIDLYPFISGRHFEVWLKTVVSDLLASRWRKYLQLQCIS